jgi:hypothetical protein
LLLSFCGVALDVVMTVHIATHAKTQPIGKNQNANHHSATHLERAQGI